MLSNLKNVLQKNRGYFLGFFRLDLCGEMFTRFEAPRAYFHARAVGKARPL